MASKPTRNGNQWRTRWRFKGEWHWISENYEADCKLAQRYVTSLGNKISMDDPRITEKAYLHGEEAVLVKAKVGRTFAAVAEAYMNTKSWGPDRNRSFRGTLKLHYKDWARWPVDEITTDHLNAKWREKSNSGWYTPKGEFRPYKRNGVIAILEIGLQVMSYAYDMGMLNGADPGKSRYLAFNRTMRRPGKRKAFTPEEFAYIRALAHPDDSQVKTTFRDYAMVTTMGVCGLRISELCGLNVEDLDVVEKMLTIQARFIRGLGRVEGRKEADEDDEPHLVGVNDSYIEFMAPLWTDRPGDAPMFPGVRLGRHLQPTRWRETIWTPLLRTAVSLGLVRDNIEIVPHVLRHSSTTWFGDHLPLHLLQDRLDHKTDKATRHYKHRSLAPERAAMDVVFPDGF